jgi:hypothetical protein
MSTPKGHHARIRDPKTNELRSTFWKLQNAYAQGDTKITSDMVDDAHTEYVRAFNQAKQAGLIG